jgi:hypothetical protein
MLNEGFALYKSLERCGIQLVRRHPDIKEPGKRPGLVVCLDKTGRVASIEFRDAEDVRRLWTIRKGNHKSFPVLKLQKPLWKLSLTHPIRKKLADLGSDESAKLKVLLSHNGGVSITPHEEMWWKGLQERAQELRPLFETADKEYVAFVTLIDRFNLATDLGDFFRDLLDCVRRSHVHIKYPFFETLLVGSENKGEFIADVPIILDVSDWGDPKTFLNRVASPRMENYVSACLFKGRPNSDSTDSAAEHHGLSALSGSDVVLESEKFPCPNMPILGNTFLFSMNSQTPCQVRYKRTSTQIFPSGRIEANSIQDALNWITDNERKGSTWYPIPGSKEGENELLIVYLDRVPVLSNKAQMLGGTTANAFSERTYENVAGAAIEALKGHLKLNANEVIRIIALRKADPGRRQLSLQRVCAVSDLVDADGIWREASKNIPGISFPFFRKEVEREVAKNTEVAPFIRSFLRDCSSKVVSISPHCPYPADIVRLTHRQWTRSGKDSACIAGVSLADVYDLFFSRNSVDPSWVETILGTVLQRTNALLIGLGGSDHRNRIIDFKSDARFTVMTTISTLGICLHKIQILKEDYMKDTFFNVGRFLSLIDTLHFEYCRHVRGGSIPPQLLGNAHLSIALDSPVTALDLLSKRIAIYQAWTKRENADSAKLARWSVGQLGKVSAILSEKMLPSSTTVAERAQILLGYLARGEGTEVENQ